VAGGYLCQVTSSTPQLAPALGIDVRLTEIERSLNLLLQVTPVNAAEAGADFERSDFGMVVTLRLRPLEFEPDLVRPDFYNLEIKNATDPLLDIPGAEERLDRLRAGASVTDLYEGDVAA